MPYEILFGDRALDRVLAADLPPEVIGGFQLRLQSLADDPARLSRKCGFPYPPHGQMYPFHCDHGGVRYYFVVFFYYLEDEQTLRVFDVTVAT